MEKGQEAPMAYPPNVAMAPAPPYPGPPADPNMGGYVGPPGQQAIHFFNICLFFSLSLVCGSYSFFSHIQFNKQFTNTPHNSLRSFSLVRLSILISNKLKSYEMSGFLVIVIGFSPCSTTGGGGAAITN